MRKLVLALILSIAVPAHTLPGGQRSPLARVGPAHRGSSIPNFNISPAHMKSILADANAKLAAQLDAVAVIPAHQRTFENTVRAVETAYADHSLELAAADFLASVSPRKDVRDAAAKLGKQSSRFLINQSFRMDVYKAVKEYAAKGEPLNGENLRLLEDTLASYERQGMGLKTDLRKRAARIKKRLAALGIEFDKNISDDMTGIEVPVERLDSLGLPKDFAARLKKSAKDGKAKILGKSPADTIQFWTHANDSELRDALVQAAHNVAADKNVPILEEALALRGEFAQLLGFPTHAHYVLAKKMAKTPETVESFLKRVRDGLLPAAQAQFNELLAAKKAEQPGAATLNDGDRFRYGDQLKRRRFDFDPSEASEYFETYRTVDEVMKIYEENLGVKFERTEPAEGQTWDPSVRFYRVSQAAGGRKIGYFYLDPFPREGKYNHFAAFNIVQGRELPDGSYRMPVAVMVANFKETLDFKEFTTLFHEFGHIMHQLLTTARHPSFSGTSVPRDFVESPSQMLERLAPLKEVLVRVSRHRVTGEPIPEALVQKLIDADGFHRAREMLRQVAIASLDMAYHTAAPPVDTTAILREVFQRVGVIAPMEGTRWQGAFAHLFGYDAGYYGYLWALRVAQNLFTVFEKGGIFNKASWGRYSRLIYERGSTFDVEDSVTDFIGGPMTDEPFFRHLGIDAPPKG